MQYVLRKDRQQPAPVLKIILEILILNVNQSVLSAQSVQIIRHASTISVKTLVLEFVELMPHVMSQIIFHNVPVILDILGMPLLHVLDSQHVRFIKIVLNNR